MDEKTIAAGANMLTYAFKVAWHTWLYSTILNSSADKSLKIFGCVAEGLYVIDRSLGFIKSAAEWIESGTDTSEEISESEES